MARDELDGEIAAGVAFWGFEEDGALLGVMGIQPVGDVDLIRQRTSCRAARGKGVGGTCSRHLRSLTSRRMLIGTWAAADWAIGFYRRNGSSWSQRGRRAARDTGRFPIADRDVGGAGESAFDQG